MWVVWGFIRGNTVCCSIAAVLVLMKQCDKSYYYYFAGQSDAHLLGLTAAAEALWIDERGCEVAPLQLLVSSYEALF